MGGNFPDPLLACPNFWNSRHTRIEKGEKMNHSNILVGASSVDFNVRAMADCFKRLHARGKMLRLFARLTGRSYSLRFLGNYETSVRDRHYAGLKTVPVEKIVGSENRGCDFDNRFNPLHAYLEKKWVNVAMAWQRGTIFPPVELTQIGDAYFVRDGHNRVSVARAFGQRFIDAEITVWEMKDKSQPVAAKKPATPRKGCVDIPIAVPAGCPKSIRC